jgi:hypothetical protein
MVDGWRVDPDGVSGVLNAVAKQATEFENSLGGSGDGKLPGVAAIAQSAAEGAQSQVIGAAISGFFEERQATLVGIQNRIRASLLGAAGATQAIIDGDEQMAATTQANAVRAASTGDFSSLEDR